VLDGKPFEAKFELLSDGREVAETYRGRQVVSSLRWEDALVVTSRTQGPNGEGTIRSRYELQ